MLKVEKSFGSYAAGRRAGKVNGARTVHRQGGDLVPRWNGQHGRVHKRGAIGTHFGDEASGGRRRITGERSEFRKIRRTGETSEVDVSGFIDCHAAEGVLSAAAEKGREQQRAAVRSEFRDEDIRARRTSVGHLALVS